jgi:hypothetical protein
VFADHGAGYVDARHARVVALCAELGLPLYKVHDSGTCYIEAVPGTMRRYGPRKADGQMHRTISSSLIVRPVPTSYLNGKFSAMKILRRT